MALYDPKEFPVEAPAINDVADKLARSRELIELGWCQNSAATDADGKAVATHWPDAVNFCMWGALARVTGTELLNGDPAWTALQYVTDGTPTLWNDDPKRTKAEVVEAFRRAEAIARGEA